MVTKRKTNTYYRHVERLTLRFEISAESTAHLGPSLSMSCQLFDNCYPYLLAFFGYPISDTGQPGFSLGQC